MVRSRFCGGGEGRGKGSGGEKREVNAGGWTQLGGSKQRESPCY